MEEKVIESHKYYELRMRQVPTHYYKIVQLEERAFSTVEDVRGFVGRFMKLGLKQMETVITFVRLSREDWYTTGFAPVLAISGPAGSGKTLLAKIIDYMCPDAFVIDPADYLLDNDMDASLAMARELFPHRFFVLTTRVQRTTDRDDVFQIDLESYGFREGDKEIGRYLKNQREYEF